MQSMGPFVATGINAFFFFYLVALHYAIYDDVCIAIIVMTSHTFVSSRSFQFACFRMSKHENCGGNIIWAHIVKFIAFLATKYRYIPAKTPSFSKCSLMIESRSRLIDLSI